MKIIGIFIIVLFCFQLSYGQEQECGPGINCTYEYIILGITITDSAGKPVLLDEYVAKNLDTDQILWSINFKNKNGERIRHHEKDWRNEGFYQIIDDDFRRYKIQKSGSPVKFIGKINNEIVVERNFKIGHDCCHVEILSGNNRVILEN